MIQNRDNWVKDCTIKAGAGIYIERAILRSKAYRKLKPTAKFLLIEFYARLQKHPEKKSRKGVKSDRFLAANNGQIELCYSWVHEHYGISSSTFGEAIDQLCEVGFLEVAEAGHGAQRKKTKYALLNSWRLYGQDGFLSGRGRAKKMINQGFKAKRNSGTTSEIED